LIEFAREAGCRQEEIASLQHALIDRRRMAVSIPSGKGNRFNELPLTPRALAIIDRQPQRLKCPWVFWHGEGQRYQEVASRFIVTRNAAAQKAAQSGAEFHPFRFHDLRHLFAVEYLRKGRGSIYSLQAVMRHGSIKTTELYLNYLTPDEVQAAMHGSAQNPAQAQRFAEGGEGA
jgi:integrase/recombinase XerD